MSNNFSFMMPITKRGALDRVALAEGMRAAKYGRLDAFADAPFVELRCSVPWVKDRGWLTFSNLGWAYDADPLGGTASFFSHGPWHPGIMSITLAQQAKVGREYLVVMEGYCWGLGANPGFDISSPSGR
jgi:hypothetical protein